MPVVGLEKQKVKRKYSIDFPQGLIGFSSAKRFVLVDEPSSKRFRWLTGVDQPNLSFLVAEPQALVSGYEFEVAEGDLAFLELDSLEDTSILVIVTVPGNPLEATVNLGSPILINTRTRRGKQIVLEQGRYPLQYTILNPSASDKVVESSSRS